MSNKIHNIQREVKGKQLLGPASILSNTAVLATVEEAVRGRRRNRQKGKIVSC